MLFLSPSKDFFQMHANSEMCSTAQDRRRVLVVDDEPTILKLVGELLRPLYDVSTAEDGEEAMEMLLNHPPDLVVTDLYMPTSDGLHLLRKIRSDARIRHIPVIIVTGRPRDETLVECFKCGAADHLSKPFNPTELTTRIAAHLRSAQNALQRTEPELIKRILENDESEKSRISSDLHEGICQTLAGIKFHVEAALLSQPATGARIGDLLKQTISQTRAIAHGLYPVQLEGGFFAALHYLAHTSESTFQVSCRCDFQKTDWVPSVLFANHLYRIVQEFIYAAKTYGQAQNILIFLFEKEGAIHLGVSNDGLPFLEHPDFKSLSFHVIHARAHLVNAQIQFEEYPSVSMTCMLPL
jgi:DNA-binding response OmpR family regulator